ncbi:MAG: DUF2490 domain-containing protein [Flavobacteriales bacterium]|nr:DUF2490 domain-containing protein [Flavobacteriales bacterium]
MQAQGSDVGNWLIYIGNKKVNSRFNLHNEIQYRNYDAIGDLEQLLLRTGLGYTFKDNSSNLLLGYGYVVSENYKDENEKYAINEHRIFQQFTSSQTIGSIKIQHRYRFEQRFVERDFIQRFRYFVSFNIPLKIKKNTQTYLSVYNEIFMNTNSPVFDRNRLYGGIGYNINNNIRIEIGYMNQFFEKYNRDQLNIISFVNF